MNAKNDALIAVPAAGTELEAIKNLSPEELDRARNLAAGLDVKDSFAVMAFGASPQKELGALTDQVLRMTATKNTGPAGQALSDLMQEVKALHADSLSAQVEGGLSRLPVVGKLFSRFQQFLSQYEAISVKIDRTVVALEKSRNTLSRDIVMIDNLYAQNATHFRDLLAFIGAGELKLQALRAEQVTSAEEAEKSGNPALAQQAADLGNAVSRLERRVHDLKLAAMVSLQSAPQMRLVQGSDQALVEKIQSSILTTIPLWKQQVIIAIGLFNQAKAQELLEQIDRTTDDLLLKNAEAIRLGVTKSAQQRESGIVKIETLRKVNQELIETIDETIKIQEEGRRKRREAEAELLQLQAELRSKLAEVRPAAVEA